jgi:thiamine biosynthesis lipoprotein
MSSEIVPVVVRTHPVMGTMASVHVHDDVDPTLIEAAIDLVWTELDRLESVFSTFRSDSEISRINRGELHLLDASPEVIEVVDACTWLEHLSNGAFRARRPGDMFVDPAGFVKGWATELAAHHLERAGLQQWYLSVGGDIQTRGRAGDGAPWRVGIADPNSDDSRSIAAIVEITGDAIATSGLAARGRHLWDGRTDLPAEGLASMTVIGPNLTWADALATAAFVMGADGVDWVSQFAGYRALAITTDGTLLRRDEQWAKAA